MSQRGQKESVSEWVLGSGNSGFTSDLRPLHHQGEAENVLTKPPRHQHLLGH